MTRKIDKTTLLMCTVFLIGVLLLLFNFFVLGSNLKNAESLVILTLLSFAGVFVAIYRNKFVRRIEKEKKTSKRKALTRIVFFLCYVTVFCCTIAILSATPARTISQKLICFAHCGPWYIILGKIGLFVLDLLGPVYLIYWEDVQHRPKLAISLFFILWIVAYGAFALDPFGQL
jgi:hypothetical protein